MKKRTPVITGLILGTIIVITFFVYASYAFFNNKIVGEGKQIKTKSSDDFYVTFNNSSEISMENAELIDDANKENDAEKIEFTINVSNLDNPSFDVNLNNLYVSTELQSVYTKWELYNTNTAEILSSGNFETCTDCENGGVTYNILSGGSLTKNEPLELGFRLWLSNAGSGIDQNDLLNGSLSGKIVVSVY